MENVGLGCDLNGLRDRVRVSVTVQLREWCAQCTGVSGRTQGRGRAPEGVQGSARKGRRVFGDAGGAPGEGKIVVEVEHREDAEHVEEGARPEQGEADIQRRGLLDE